MKSTYTLKRFKGAFIFRRKAIFVRFFGMRPPVSCLPQEVQHIRPPIGLKSIDNFEKYPLPSMNTNKFSFKFVPQRSNMELKVFVMETIKEIIQGMVEAQRQIIPQLTIRTTDSYK